jgi:hypothetical protein
MYAHMNHLAVMIAAKSLQGRHHSCFYQLETVILTGAFLMRTRVQTLPAFGRSYSGRTDRMAEIRRWSRLLDSQFTFPGTNFKFGLDPLIGLFLPGLGSVGTAIMSLVLISTMRKHGASGHVVVRMLLNVALDTVVGAIPILGNIFDFTFRANDRNVELLRQHYEEGRHQGSGKGLIAAVVAGFLAVCGLIVWGVVAMIAWLWHAVQ